MLTLIALAVMSTAPAADCGSCRLLAQSGPEVSPPPPPPAWTEPGAIRPGRTAELELQISDLQRRIRGIDVNWPTGYLVLAYAGYVVGVPAALFGLGFLISGVALAATDPTIPSGLFIGIGAASLALAVVALVVVLYVVGQAGEAVAQRRREREDLIRQREVLEAELKALRSSGPSSGGWLPTPMVTVLRF